MSEHQDYRERDRLDFEALQTIERLFAGTELNPDEQTFVDAAGPKLAEYALQLVYNAPSMMNVRPMVVMYAMAYILGGPWAQEGGLSQLRRESTTMPQSGAG